MPCSIAALISGPSGSDSMPARMPPSPSFGESPAAASVAPCSANTSGRKARTTWPKMIGSETFIIVALRCTENSTPSAFARATCAVRNSRSDATRITVASTTSPVEDRHLLPQHGRGPVVPDQLDAQGRRPCEHRGLLVVPEVVGRHVRDVGLRVRGPRPHRVRVRARVVLHRERRPAVGVALAQHRVDRRALDGVVRRADRPLLVGRRRLGVVGQVVALLLQLLDRRLELRDRGADVGQLDDVGLAASWPARPARRGRRRGAARR